MRISSTQPRRQRKALYEATTFERRRRMTVPLSRELRTRFKRRNVPIRKGDTVRILSGSYKGSEERVARVDRSAYSVTLDNITGKTGDQKLKPMPIRLSHLVITRLNLADPWRRRTLRVAEAEVAEEESATPSVDAPKPSTPTEPSPSETKSDKAEATRPKRKPKSEESA